MLQLRAIAAAGRTGYKAAMDGKAYDLIVIGGGINGAGIARDAAGRGLRVALLERGDFAGGTSSASSKLIHGGLRYLEHFEFRLVAESLREREVLLRIAPHLVTPLRFVLPHARGSRPAWMMRAGLGLYDRLGGRGALPGSCSISLAGAPEGEPLDPSLRRGLTYWDASVDDARLVLANVRSAAQLGAAVLPRTAFRNARRESGGWVVEISDAGGQVTHLHARVLVNAAGPWVEQVLGSIAHGPLQAHTQLVKGSHIVVPRVTAGTHAYILQHTDQRVVFMLPFEEDYSLIGTTDVAIDAPEQGMSITTGEIRYLLDAANRYLAVPLHESDVVWTYSGVRPLYDDGSRNPSATTRDYTLALDTAADAPLLSIYGGKLTTYRTLAEAALARLRPWLPGQRGPWTATEALPGGAGLDDIAAARRELQSRYDFLPARVIERLFRRHGTLTDAVLGGARNEQALGRHFGAGLYEREVRYFIDEEWARTVEDILWRRTKAGLHLNAPERAAFESWFDAQQTPVCQSMDATSP